MKSSVCALTRETPAQIILNALRAERIEANRAIIDAPNLPIDNPCLYVIAAENNLHPTVLEEVAKLENTHPFLLRCENCGSARLDISLEEQLTGFLRTCRHLAHTFGPPHAPIPALVRCRECNNRTGVEYHAPFECGNPGCLVALIPT